MNEIMAQGVAALITYLGPTPILLVVVLLGLGPIGAVVWIVFKLNKIVGKITTAQNEHNAAVFERQDKRFEQVVRMYEDNVALVKNYERHVANQRETNDNLIDLVQISTATQKELVETSRHNADTIMLTFKSNAEMLTKMIENNESCPFSRPGRMRVTIEEERK